MITQLVYRFSKYLIFGESRIRMKLSECIAQTAKYVILLFNGMMGATGLALVVLGIIYYMFYERYGLNLFWDFFSMGALTIGVGGIMFLIAGFGCCGALHQNNCLLTMYGFILILLLLVQLAVGIIAILKIYDYNEFFKTVKKLIDNLYNKADADSIKTFHDLQQKFSCCGVNNSSDYTNTNYLPASCCKGLLSPCYGDSIYITGCASAFAETTKLFILVIGAVAIGFATIDLCGIIFAYLVRRENMRNDIKFRTPSIEETSI